MGRVGAILRGGGAGLALVALSGCMMPAPPPAAGPPVGPAAAVAPPTVSQASRAVAAHFARQEASLRARGFMRTDGGGADAPFNATTLAANFERIALFDEYADVGGRLVPGPVPSALRRWEAPVRMRLEFGDSVPQSVRARDTRDVAAYATRLGRLTRHPVSMLAPQAARDVANFHILVLNEDERRASAATLRALVPGIDEGSVRLVTDLPLGVSCLVLAFARGDSHVYSGALAVIRAELPDLTRLSCYHEELAQGLGLPNDSPQARPSIFNDTQEFALLTRHDELLLRMLYDQRLRPGMRAPEARPIIRRLASELMGGET